MSYNVEGYHYLTEEEKQALDAAFERILNTAGGINMVPVRLSLVMDQAINSANGVVALNTQVSALHTTVGQLTGGSSEPLATKAYVDDLFAWLNGIAGTPGPQGLQGDVGIAGPQGTMGIMGDVGLAGSNGVQGITGDPGSQGIQGNIGAQGSTGLTGVAGIQGIRGFTGSAGSVGDTGDQGYTGPAGPTGLQGPQGIQGIQGNVGPSAIASINSFTATLTPGNDEVRGTVTGLLSMPSNVIVNVVMETGVLIQSGIKYSIRVDKLNSDGFDWTVVCIDDDYWPGPSNVTLKVSYLWS